MKATITMEKIIKNYIETSKVYESSIQELERKIEKRRADIQRAERSILRLVKKKNKLNYPSWVDYLIKPIGEIFSEEFQMPFDIYGPFGIRAQTTIYWVKDISIPITDQPVRKLTLVPLDLSKGELGYETGKIIDPSYKPGSIGYLNGFGKEVLPLPNSIKEIRELIQFKN